MEIVIVRDKKFLDYAFKKGLITRSVINAVAVVTEEVPGTGNLRVEFTESRKLNKEI